MRRPTRSPINSTSITLSTGFKSCMSLRTPSRRRATGKRMRKNWPRSVDFWRIRFLRRALWLGTSARHAERRCRTRLTPPFYASYPLCSVRIQSPNRTSTDRTQHSAVSKLELQVRYTTTLWGWMHDMRYELPPQRKWPPGVHPPGNASASATPTMEKLALQGNHAVEQKEVCLRVGARTRGD